MICCRIFCDSSGLAIRFKNILLSLVLPGHLKYPELTLTRRWVQMRRVILTSEENEIFFVPEAGEIEIIVNRDMQRLIEADVKRYRERYETGGK